jgi:hypothetical protein
MEPNIVDLKTASDISGISVPMLLYYIRTRRLPKNMLGGSHVLSMETLTRFVVEHRSGAFKSGPKRKPTT